MAAGLVLSIALCMFCFGLPHVGPEYRVLGVHVSRAHSVVWTVCNSRSQK